jgi:hypothetical protein
MALSNRSLLQAKQVLKEILDSNVDVIVTRATLDIKIEIIKFPWLKSSHERNPKNQTIYTSQQYDPIRYFMISRGFLRQEYNQNKYWYYVNKAVIRDYLYNDVLPIANISTKRNEYMTKKEKTLQHIEAHNNEMRYIDIIKFVYEMNNGIGSFDPTENRGYYSGAFRKNATYRNGHRIPDGHFVKNNPKGYLFKLPNGLWAVCRPGGKKKEDTKINIDRFLPEDQYNRMCNILAAHGITSNQLDNLATKYWYKGDGDVTSCYHWAYADLLPQNKISDTVKDLYKELDRIADEMIAENKSQEKKYMIVWKTGGEKDIVEGIFSEQKVKDFFESRSIKDYYVVEIAKMANIEKKVTTTITIA